MKKRRSTESIVMRALLKQENWSPILSKIAKENKIPVSTVHDVCRRLRRKKAFVLIVEEFPLSEQR